MSDEHATLDDFLDAGSDHGSDASPGKSDPSPEASGDPASDADPTSDVADETASTPPAASPSDAASTSEIASPTGPEGAVDPAESTYRWTGAGARCDGCGAHVERLWRDGAGLVCGDCKEW